MTKDTDFLTEINTLKNSKALRKRKYTRNASVYYQVPLFLDNAGTEMTWIPGYTDLNASDVEADRIPGLTENVVASAVDTLVSQVASQKVRPSFVTVDGDWRDIMSTRMCQRFFDLYFDRQNINTVITEVFNDACIFDTGYIYLDPETFDIYRVAPWKVYFDNYEEAYGDRTKVLLYFKNYPTTLLKNYKGKERTVEYCRYYSIKDEVYIETINGKITRKEKYDKGVLPVLDMKYSLDAVQGGYSLVDRLFGIQLTINGIAKTIYMCLKRNMAQTFFVPEGSDLSVKQLDNRVGNIIEYRPNGVSGQPVVPFTPAPFDGTYMSTLKQLKQDAFEISGVSYVAARGEKPAGLDSGKALEAFEAQQDARFQTQMNRVIRLYTAIAFTMLKLFDKNKDILPDYDFKWKDVVKASEDFKIQYAVQSSVSKSPEQKLAYISSLVNAGYITKEVAATMLDLPDAERATSLATNTFNAVSAVINDCLENDNFTVPFYIPIPELKSEIRNTILSTVGSKSKDTMEVVAKLSKLYQSAMELEMNMAIQEQNEQQEKQEQELDETIADLEQQEEAISDPETVESFEQVEI